MRRIATRLLDTWRRFGMVAVVRLLVDRVVNRVFSVIDVVWLDGPAARPTFAFGAPVEFRFLRAEEVRRFAEDPANDLSPEFADRAAAGRDLCFAALADEGLAAYAWYAPESVEPLHTLGVPMAYPRDVAYLYKTFTLPAYRGAHLNAMAMALARERLSEHGITKIVALVDWTNTASLRSCARIGYVRLGRLWVIRLGTRTLVFAPRRAKRLGIQFGRTTRLTLRAA